MDQFIKELGREIAERLIKFEDQKGYTRRPEGQTLYEAETVKIMDDLKVEVLLQMGYNNDQE